MMMSKTEKYLDVCTGREKFLSIFKWYSEQRMNYNWYDTEIEEKN